MANLININDADFAKSAVKYRSQLLMAPVIGAKSTLQHMTGRPGVRGRDTVGEIFGDAQIGPYSSTRKDESDLTVKVRTLETFLGSLMKDFDPNQVWQTVLGSLVTKGEALKNVDIARQVLMFITLRLGKNLAPAVWNAKRNDAGTKTVDLFNGFDTIAQTEIASGGLSAAKGNYIKITEVIDKTNAVDQLKAIYQGASEELQGQKVKMFITPNLYNAYTEDYQSTVGAVPYNTQYEKTFLEGSQNKCELVPLASKAGSKYIQLTPKSNMLYGYGNGGDQEKVLVEKHHPLLLTYVATMFFGCQYESISPEVLRVAELATE